MDRKMKMVLLALLATLLFIVGCSKVTKENYDKLKMGMEYSEVTTLLGSPDTCTDSMGTKSCIWGSESKNITVNFIGDKTIVFAATGLK